MSARRWKAGMVRSLRSGRTSVRGALDGLKYGARSALSPRVLQGAAVELGWLTTHLAMYPLGLVSGSGSRTERLTLAGLTPAQRSLLVSDVRAAGTPILLAHGIIDNHTVFAADAPATAAPRVQQHPHLLVLTADARTYAVPRNGWATRSRRSARSPGRTRSMWSGTASAG